ncbi:MAG: hypothetical protein FJ290_14390 [Planctomycetes bacterium]|nr:hypothetical protein [Planctomycetota bacterium]
MSSHLRAVLLLAVLSAPAIAGEGPWPAPVAGFAEPKPGEHPRLFFRRADLPELRRRATEAAEGRAIVARLRLLLGNNGEALPTMWNPAYPINIGPKGRGTLPVGAFTMSHAAGHGMLYQLTGDKKHADLARECLERMFNPKLHRVTADVIQKDRAGQWEPRGARFAGKQPSEVVVEYGEPDRDERYTWSHPGAGLRVGPMMAWVALAYDLCYDAWDEAFRLRVVKELLDYNHLPVDYDKFAEGHKGNVTMVRLVNCSYPPESNHFGAYIGGAGIALLAVRRDPGADEARVEPWLAKIEKQALRLLTEGFGDHGFFAEGHGPSHMATATAFIPFLQAARTAWGKDFISPRPNAQWLLLRWPMEVVAGEKPWFPNYHPSSYGADHVEHSGDAYWSLGFGALANDDQRAAMLWTYLYAIEKEPKVFDAEVYPGHAAMALINWPIGLKPKNPGEVLGHVNVDQYMGHYMFRKQWQDADDLYFTFFLNPRGKHGYVRGPRNGNFAFYGYGIRCRWSHGLGTPRKETHFEAWPDGSGVLSFEHGEPRKVTAIAVDYTEKSGAGAVVAIANPWFKPEDLTRVDWHRLLPQKARDGKAALSFQDVAVPGVPFFLMVMHRGDAPKAVVEGDSVKLGGQTYRFDGAKLIFGK